MDHRLTRSFAVLAVLAVLAPGLPERAVAQGAHYFKLAEWNRPVTGAQRLPDTKLDESRTPAMVTVITESEIRASGARTLQELFSRHAAINQFDSIGNSFQATVDMRGFNGEPGPATAVLVDGVRVNEANLNQVNYHLIPAADIERIEIHSGPSTLFGRDALAGTIQITTKRGGKDRVEAEAGAAAGSFARKKGHAAVGGTIPTGAGDFDYRVFSTRETESGHRNQSRAAISNHKIKIGYRKDERVDAALSYQRSDDRLQQPGALTGPELAADPRQAVSEVDTVSRMDFLNYNHRQALSETLSVAVNGHLRKRYENTPKNKGRTSTSEAYADMRTEGVTGQFSRDSELFGRRSVATLGVEVERKRADSLGVSGTFKFGNEAKDDAYGVFAQHALDLVPEKLILTTGLRYDENEIRNRDKFTATNSGEERFHRTSPRIGLNYNPSETLQTFVSYAENFRTPTISEMSSLQTSILKPVRSKNIEVGARAKLAEGLTLRGTVYRSYIRDQIFFSYDSANPFGKNMNLEKTRRTGVEWGLTGRKGIFEGTFNHAYTKATFQSNVVLGDQPFGVKQFVGPGDQIPMTPEHRVSAGLSARPGKGWTLSLNEACTGAQPISGDDDNNEASLPAFCLTNLGASYDAGSWSAFLNGFNVFDQSYQTRGILSSLGGKKTRFFTPGAGVNFQAGVNYRFSAGQGSLPAAKKASKGLVELARRAWRGGSSAVPGSMGAKGRRAVRR